MLETRVASISKPDAAVWCHGCILGPREGIGADTTDTGGPDEGACRAELLDPLVETVDAVRGAVRSNGDSECLCESGSRRVRTFDLQQRRRGRERHAGRREDEHAVAPEVVADDIAVGLYGHPAEKGELAGGHRRRARLVAPLSVLSEPHWIAQRAHVVD